jgi:folate-binding protein YgfZ
VSELLSCIRVPGGEQAAKFLQGQVTCDVREVTENKSCLSAHCDPKGRVQFVFELFKQGDDYYLQMLRVLIPQAIALLQKYAQFFKIKLEGVEHPSPGLRPPSPQRGEGFPEKNSPDQWKLQNIIAGIPTIYPETVGLFTPHQINLQLLNAVSFTKGCYTGQEIIARMQYLGKLKQQMYRVSFVAEKNFAPGSKLYDANAQEIGELVDSAFENDQQQQALAVLQNTAITQAIYLGNVDGPILTVLDLPYTRGNI